jgi:hypothetical protein
MLFHSRQREKQIGSYISYLCYDARVKKAERLTKTVDETAEVRCADSRGIIREEVWQDSKGKIARYNLAFINPHLCVKDNGRVLGYDNSHGEHHRHSMGSAEISEFTNYEELLSKFLAEVHELRKRRVS